MCITVQLLEYVLCCWLSNRHGMNSSQPLKMMLTVLVSAEDLSSRLFVPVCFQCLHTGFPLLSCALTLTDSSCWGLCSPMWPHLALITSLQTDFQHSHILRNGRLEWPGVVQFSPLHTGGQKWPLVSNQNQTEPVKVWTAVNARQESIQMF